MVDGTITIEVPFPLSNSCADRLGSIVKGHCQGRTAACLCSYEVCDGALSCDIARLSHGVRSAGRSRSQFDSVSSRSGIAVRRRTLAVVGRTVSEVPYPAGYSSSVAV